MLRNRAVPSGSCLRILDRSAPADPVEIANLPSGSRRLEHSLYRVHGRKTLGARECLVAHHRTIEQVDDGLEHGQERAAIEDPRDHVGI